VLSGFANRQCVASLKFRKAYDLISEFDLKAHGDRGLQLYANRISVDEIGSGLLKNSIFLKTAEISGIENVQEN
jgi:hypothetical protein